MANPPRSRADQLAAVDAREAAAAGSADPATTGDTVTIACKVPNGLLLRVFRMTSQPVPVLGGGTRDEPRAEHMGDNVHIKGPAAPFGAIPRAEVSGGFALTHGVSKEFWDLWLEQNARHPAVLNGLIFAAPNREHAFDAAKERRDLATGFEALDPDNGDRRVSKQIKKDDSRTAA